MRDYAFGNYLYQLRISKELSQFQLGSLLGVSDKAVSKWENGISYPKIDILIKLANIFNISVDELLSIKKTGSFEDAYYTNKKLWADIYDRIADKYGVNPPYEIYNRFLSEYYEFIKTNHEAIKYLELLKNIKDELRKNGEFFKAESFINSLFIPYIMGITNINPLPPHYYCPKCKKVEFHKDLYTCWDLPHKLCSCGEAFVRDGHNIPFETAGQENLNSCGNNYRLLISKSSIDKVCDLICSSFEGEMSVIREEHRTIIVNNNNLNKFENEKSYIQKPYTSKIIIRNAKVADKISDIERKTGVLIENLNFNKDCLNYIFDNPINEFVKQLIFELKPNSFTFLIKSESFTRTDGVLENYKKCLIDHGIDIYRGIAYREDIFDYIKKLTNDSYTGFANEIMYRASRGRFQSGIPENIMHNLNEINAEQWFIDAIQRIEFLNSKCFGVSSAQFELAFAWYNINFPDITKTIFK